MARGRRTRKGALIRKLGPMRSIRTFNHYTDCIYGQTYRTILSTAGGQYGIQLVGDYCTYKNFSVNNCKDFYTRNVRSCMWRPISVQVWIRPVSNIKVWYARDAANNIVGAPLGNPIESSKFRIRTAPFIFNNPNHDIVTDDEGSIERMCKVKTHPVGRWSSFYAWKVPRHQRAGKYLELTELPQTNTEAAWDLVLGSGKTSIGHFADMYSNTLNHDIGAKWMCIDNISDGYQADPDGATKPGVGVCAVNSITLEIKLMFKCEFFGQRTLNTVPSYLSNEVMDESPDKKICVVCEDNCIHDNPLE